MKFSAAANGVRAFNAMLELLKRAEATESVAQRVVYSAAGLTLAFMNSEITQDEWLDALMGAPVEHVPNMAKTIRHALQVLKEVPSDPAE